MEQANVDKTKIEKMRMESVDGTAKNIDKLEEMFPNCITEKKDENGKLKKAVNFELLKQMLSREVLAGDEAKDLTRKMKKGSYDLEDFLTNMKQIRKLGPLENILKMLPGARNMGLNNINIDPKDMAHVEAIVLSMTPYERRHPEVLKASRKIRIAKGSGRSVEEVNRLLKQFEMMKDMMKKMSSGNFKMPF